MSSNFSIFFLGATGYLGSEVIALLATEYPHFRVVALLRDVSTASGLAKVTRLHALHPNVRIVEGTLDSGDIIRQEAAQADIVINCASSDHAASVKSTLAGLEENSASRPGNPPLYIHVSGCGIISDNARGEPVPVDRIQEWSDIDLDLNSCPPTNMHLESDIPIVKAGTRAQNPIRSIIVFPAQIYGIGSGVAKTTLWLRIFLDLTRSLGYTGTWGPGANAMNNIHVTDVATAVLAVLKGALEGKADEGKNGLYFASTMAPKSTYHEWTEVMGNILYDKGLIGQPGTRPMPASVVDPLGHYGWSLLGGNQFSRPERLAKLGWAPVETEKKNMMDSLPEMIDEALAEMGWTAPISK